MTEVAAVDPLVHLDDDGHSCARHRAELAALMQLALVGSRAPAFHHDCASKLQGLVMALDEAMEVAEARDPHLQRALDAAQTAARELHALLNINRALARPAARSKTTLRELVARGAERVGVTVRGALPEAELEVVVPAMIHALALAIDVAAGSGRGRSLELSATVGAGHCVLRLAAAAPQANASELLAIAAFVIVRDRGELRCAVTGNQITIRLPV